MRIAGPEQRRCPPEFQDRITRLFGKNIFGEPLFKVVWGQSVFHRMGNVWRDVYGNERRGYRERYLAGGTPCWNILRWKPAEHYGTPAVWYLNTWDEFSRMFILGEYPWKGRYEVLQSLHRREVIDGKLVITHFPLSHVLIDKLIPMMVAFQFMSEQEKKAAREFVRQKEEKIESEQNADRMESNLPAWYGPVSFSRQGIKTSLLDRKMEQIKKHWDRLSRRGIRPDFQRGFQMGPAPRRLSGKPI